MAKLACQICAHHSHGVGLCNRYPMLGCAVCTGISLAILAVLRVGCLFHSVAMVHLLSACVRLCFVAKMSAESRFQRRCAQFSKLSRNMRVCMNLGITGCQNTVGNCMKSCSEPSPSGLLNSPDSLSQLPVPYTGACMHTISMLREFSFHAIDNTRST